jgi:hypothetical protein
LGQLFRNQECAAVCTWLQPGPVGRPLTEACMLFAGIHEPAASPAIPRPHQSKRSRFLLPPNRRPAWCTRCRCRRSQSQRRRKRRGQAGDDHHKAGDRPRGFAQLSTGSPPLQGPCMGSVYVARDATHWGGTQLNRTLKHSRLQVVTVFTQAFKASPWRSEHTGAPMALISNRLPLSLEHQQRLSRL